MCKFFRAIRSEYKQKCLPIKGLLTDEVSSKRNAVFHQLRGLQEQDLYDYWGVRDFDEWEKRLLEYLNFISQQSFTRWNEAIAYDTATPNDWKRLVRRARRSLIGLHHDR